MHRLKRWEISFCCSVARTSWSALAVVGSSFVSRNLSFLNSYVHSAELHNKQEFLHPSALKCRFFAQNSWLHFQAVLHSSQPSSKILQSCFFREELDCTTPDLQAFFCGLLSGRQEERHLGSFHFFRTMAGEL